MTPFGGAFVPGRCFVKARVGVVQMSVRMAMKVDVWRTIVPNRHFLARVRMGHGHPLQRQDNDGQDCEQDTEHGFRLFNE